MLKVHTNYYLAAVIAGFSLNILLGIITSFIAREHSSDVIAWQSAQMIPGMILTITICVLWYRAWTLLQAGDVMTTPGKAVGFLFIPIFNLYWLFKVSYGFATTYNKLFVKGVEESNSLSTGIFIVYPAYFIILSILSLTPLAMTMFWPVFLGVAMVITIMLVRTVCGAINKQATE